MKISIVLLFVCLGLLAVESKPIANVTCSFPNGKSKKKNCKSLIT